MSSAVTTYTPGCLYCDLAQLPDPPRASDVAAAEDSVRRGHARIEIHVAITDLPHDDLIVIRRCIERLAALRIAIVNGVENEGRPWSALDEALRIELTDVRLGREQEGGADVQR